MTEQRDGECTMTFSALVHDRTGKRIVRVQFERPGVVRGERDVAEAVVPGGRIGKSRGFSEEERKQLTAYLVANEADILARAKAISNPMRWMS